MCALCCQRVLHALLPIQHQNDGIISTVIVWCRPQQGSMQPVTKRHWQRQRQGYGRGARRVAAAAHTTRVIYFAAVLNAVAAVARTHRHVNASGCTAVKRGAGSNRVDTGVIERQGKRAGGRAQEELGGELRVSAGEESRASQLKGTESTCHQRARVEGLT